MRRPLAYLGGLLLIIWGISHIIPTNNVIKGFGPISADNVHIIAMEWINEGFTLIFLGLLSIAVTVINDNKSKVSKLVYILTFIMLLAMSVLSLFTGFRVDFLPFKLCPLIFMISALLIVQGAYSGREKTN
jgi:uncharacterized membrane protein YwaF